MLGLANFLAIHGVSYAAFGEALGDLNAKRDTSKPGSHPCP